MLVIRECMGIKPNTHSEHTKFVLQTMTELLIWKDGETFNKHLYDFNKVVQR